MSKVLTILLLIGKIRIDRWQRGQGVDIQRGDLGIRIVLGPGSIHVAFLPEQDDAKDGGIAECRTGHDACSGKALGQIRGAERAFDRTPVFIDCHLIGGDGCGTTDRNGGYRTGYVGVPTANLDISQRGRIGKLGDLFDQPLMLCGSLEIVLIERNGKLCIGYRLHGNNRR